MTPGTIIELPDGRRGTVVYNGLDGVGIKWGQYDISIEDLQGSGGLFNDDVSEDYEWTAEAMLRNNYPSAELPCIGEEYKIIKKEEE